MTTIQTIYLDTDASAVSINPHNGFIAVAIGSQISIYEPEHEHMKIPRWQLLTKLIDESNHTNINAIDWGLKNEVVTGSDRLTLWRIEVDYGKVSTSIIWNMRQPSKVYMAKISQDSSLIASCGYFDKLLKVWNRVTFSENSIFDISYLHHPTSITNIRWKKYDIESPPKKEIFTNTLYSLSRDSILRIYSSVDKDEEYHNVNSRNNREFQNKASNIQLLHNHDMQHWGSLDLNDALPGNNEINSQKKKFINIIDEHLVKAGLLNAAKKLYNKDSMNFQKLDLVFAATDDGEVSVFGLENLSLNPPKLVNISKLKDLKFHPSAFVKNPEFICYTDTVVDDQGDLSIVIHDLNGVIRNTTLDLRFLLQDESTNSIGDLSHKFIGHLKSIQNIVRTSDGEALLTTSRFEENAVWVPQYLKDSVTLAKKSVVHTPRPISKSVLLEKGDRLITICEKHLILWDTSKKIAKELYRFELEQIFQKPLWVGVIPMKKHDPNRHHLVAVYENYTKAWAILESNIETIEIDDIHSLIPDEEIAKLAPIDPVTANPNPHRPILSTITPKGGLRCFSADFDEQTKKLSWVQTYYLETNIGNASYIRGSSIAKFAIAVDNKLTIWNLHTNVMEFEETFKEPIRDIDWTSTEYEQSILAVGFEHSSLLYTQLRYDYTNDAPSYLAIKKIDITKYTTHSIGDSIWLKDGILAIGSGNQIFISDKYLDIANDKLTKKSIGSRNIISNDLLNLSSVLNGPVPLYHPQMLIQMLFNGKFEIVKEILLRLFLKIRAFEMESKPIDSIGLNLGFDVSKIYEAHYVESDDFEEPYDKFNSNVAESLKEKLSLKHSLPYLTRHQQITLVSTIEAVEDMDFNKLDLDANGLRFFLAVKLFQLHRGGSQKKLSMRDINWALHSENKELLLQVIKSSFKPGENISWNIVLEYGLAHWLRYEDLISIFEEIARYSFNSGDFRDPSKCSIYYLALKKKQILLGLWKTAFGHKDKQKMINFLSNNFKEERWRKAAIKNAYALLSKHRYMDSAGFFLLGDSLKDAANVLINEVEDIDLAIAICRVYEGDNGPILTSILKSNVLTDAISSGNRWLCSYVYWKSRAQSKAIQSLIKSPLDIVDDSMKTRIKSNENSKSFLDDDPLLIVLYKNLREKNLHYFQGSLEISPNIEREFILRVSSIYIRMGCDYLALDLVKQWTFFKVENFKREESYIDLKIGSTEKSNNDLAKFGLSPTIKRRSSILDSYKSNQQNINSINNNTTSSILDSYQPSNDIDNSNKNKGISILERYGLAQTNQKSEESLKEIEDYNKKIQNHAPPPKSAFEEPDMSSFNFGF
ncbi:hypothetical protein WICMUC_005669 [Wickerhamomyces mucosus]|uniref:RAVE complex protein Rav1 C-terminal domain-containing protein n=1 Tax=Wickerhamomyces mucosus TaxID=1378264 RepID=A0A9P8P7C4_9ASCO|nr:hypothetical protein WICMUC_005669 [Wickerhamomyces mucosus]